MCCLLRSCACEHAIVYLYNTTCLSVVCRSFASDGGGVISSRHNGTCIFNSLLVIYVHRYSLATFIVHFYTSYKRSRLFLVFPFYKAALHTL